MVTAVSRAQSKVTLNELLDTLRLLEEEPELLPPPKLLKKDRYAWMDGVSRAALGSSSPASAYWEGKKRSWFTAGEGGGGV